MYAEGDVNPQLEGELAAEVMRRVIAYFGGAPFSHYTAHVELLRPVSADHKYNLSMEHLDSSTFFLGVDRGLTARSDAERRDVERFNFAHHFAHAWIPKRAYGEGYFPFQWEMAPMIDTIWFSEGFARYIAIEALTDALPEAEARAYRERRLDQFRENLASAPAFLRKMSLVELSRVGSTRYAEDFRTGRSLFSRGTLMAAELDERIRALSGGRKGLRDALRYLVAWSAREHRPFRIDELSAIFARATGVDTRAIVDRWLRPL
jgi:predicted metalloprotease with PDZ domain